MKEVILCAKNLKKIVLRDVSADFYKGDFTVIMGSSGAGKSTLLYALSRTDKVEKGDMFFKDVNISNVSEKQMAKIRSESFGFVFQSANLISNVTLYENVLVAGFLDADRSEKELRNETDKIFEQMKLNDVKDHLPSEASGGEQQRCAIARAIINKPDIIFADEPTGALNKQNSTEVLNILSFLNQQGQTILMVTHDIRSAIRGNRILYLEDGSIVSELNLGTFEDVEEKMKQREEKLSLWLKDLQW